MQVDEAYFDTNVFVIAALSDGKAKEILKRIASGGVSALTSVLTWDEFVWAVRHSLSDYEFAKLEGRRFLSLPNVEFAEAGFDIVLKAQELVEKYNAKPRDALHAATAILNGVKVIVSDDADFDRISELKRIAISDF